MHGGIDFENTVIHISDLDKKGRTGVREVLELMGMCNAGPVDSYNGGVEIVLRFGDSFEANCCSILLGVVDVDYQRHGVEEYSELSRG